MRAKIEAERRKAKAKRDKRKEAPTRCPRPLPPIPVTGLAIAQSTMGGMQGFGNVNNSNGPPGDQIPRGYGQPAGQGGRNIPGGMGGQAGMRNSPGMQYAQLNDNYLF